MSEALQIAIGFVVGLVSGTGFVLLLFIGFCTVFGLRKLRKTAGGTLVIKSLDETVTRQPFRYLTPDVPRGPVDQLHTPEPISRDTRPS